MGFRPEPKQYRLKFIDDEHLAGLEVVMGSVSVGEYNKMMRFGMVLGLNEEAIQANDWIIELFVSRLVSWNLEDEEGKPVPANEEGVLGQERWIIAKVLTAWQMSLVQISDPLVPPSQNGGQSEEKSLNLGDSSESLPS